MHKTLVLGVLLVFALSGQVSSGNHPLISILGTETISVQATQKAKSVSPKTDIPKAPNAKKNPQLNPSLVAVNKMLKAAKEMHHQADLYNQELAKLMQDHAMMQNPFIKSTVAVINNIAYKPNIDELCAKTEDLQRGLLQVLNASNTK
jgi:L-arabinose isomerase